MVLTILHEFSEIVNSYEREYDGNLIKFVLQIVSILLRPAKDRTIKEASGMRTPVNQKNRSFYHDPKVNP